MVMPGNRCLRGFALPSARVFKASCTTISGFGTCFQLAARLGVATWASGVPEP